jgi:trimeric autotransporter adhesin
MRRKREISFLVCTLLFSVPAFVETGAAADVETVGDLNVQGVIESSGGVKFPDGITQTSACNACVNGVLPITLGGTGGDTATEARANLGVPGLATRNTFTAGQTIQGYLTTTGDLNLPATGLITAGGNRLIHSYGWENFFAGTNAGNFTTVGSSNTASGAMALYSNVSGNNNTAGGWSALYSNTNGQDNTAIGASALYTNTTGGANSAIGALALSKNTTGYHNTASGWSALSKNTIGIENTASGASALLYNTTAGGNTAVGNMALRSQAFTNGNTAWYTYNTALGYQALYSNQPTTTSNGNMNTAVGSTALYKNTTGASNMASGAGALSMNTTGSGNTASGTVALLNNSEGNYNTAGGLSALNNNFTGSYNTAIGNSALFRSNGSSNTAIGRLAGSGLVNGDNNIYIGADVLTAITTESNTLRIGSGISSVFISGISGATSSGGSAVYVNTSGQLGTLTSSRRFKEEVQDMGDATAGLMKLRPVTFYYKKEYADGPRLLQYGLIAEEVAEVYPGLVQYDEKGEMNTVYYHFVNAMLLNEVQKQQRWMEEHEKMIESQNEMIRMQRENILSLEGRLARIENMLASK